MIRHLAVVFGGRIAFVALSFIATSLVLRHLGTEQAGVFWVCLMAIKIVTGCLADSLDFAVLRTVPHNLAENRPAALDTLRAAFWLRMAAVAALMLAAASLGPQLSALVFQMPGYGHMLVLTALALSGEMLARSAMSYFQASQRFQALVVVDITVQAGRFLGVVALLQLGWLSALTALCVWLSVPFVAFAVSLPRLPPDVRRPAFASRSELAGVFRYSRWMVLVMAIAAVYERMDVMLLSTFRGPAEVGMYAPAAMLATLPELLVSVVLTVLNPQVARFYHANRYQELVRTYLRFSIPVGVLGIAAVFTIGAPVIEAIYGPRYAEAASLFRILAVGTIGFAAVTPAYSALLSLFAPRRVLGVTLAGLALTSAGGAVLIPQYGATGAAVAVTLARLAVAGAIVLLANGVIGQKRSPEPAVQAAQAGDLPC